MKRANVVPFHRPNSLRRAVRKALGHSVLERHRMACRALSALAADLDRELQDLPRGESR